MDQTHHEKEISLIVCSSDPDQTAKKIDELTNINDHTLNLKRSRIILDRYFDTANHSLQDKKIALRLRTRGAEHILGLKGPSNVTDNMIQDRLEIEGMWSKKTLDLIIDALNNLGVNIEKKYDESDIVEPLKTLEKIGLNRVQERQNIRKVKVITDGRIKLTEITLDQVSYFFDGKKIKQYFVEIEARVAEDVNFISEIANWVQEKFPQEIKIWKYSKLATGKEIENMLTAGNSEFFANSNLTPAGYTEIERRLM